MSLNNIAQKYQATSPSTAALENCQGDFMGGKKGVLGRAEN
jgi:hypothetical protein